MSKSALTDFNPGVTSDAVSLRTQEFQVLSNDDIKGFVDGVEARSQAQWSVMQSQMEAEMHLNQEQADFLRQQFRQEAQQTVLYCQQQYEQIKTEAWNHNQMWVQSVMKNVGQVGKK